MVFCLTKISAKILVHLLGYSFCAEHHILAHFCLLLLPQKSSKIICKKNSSALAPKMLVKLTPDKLPMEQHDLKIVNIS
jgi:hypothetical protein